MLKEFKPAILFVVRFLGIYFIGNILYGLYVESYGDYPDAMTQLVSRQTSFLLNLGDADSHTSINPHRPTVFLANTTKTVLNIYEGCNGINVMIVFIAFVAAFGGKPLRMFLFMLAGLVIVHIFNLLRLVLLYFTAEYYRQFFYYLHKYFFTAIIYAVVFVLWAVWIFWFNRKTDATATAE